MGIPIPVDQVIDGVYFLNFLFCPKRAPPRYLYPKPVQAG